MWERDRGSRYLGQNFAVLLLLLVRCFMIKEKGSCRGYLWESLEGVG